MRRSLIGSTSFSVVFLLLAISSLTKAQATRTWVSGVGDDVNSCSRTAPCKTFAGALAKTTTGGEIDCLASGGFGAVTISKSVTIDGTGCQASILSSGGVTGISVNISSTADTAKTVRLRRLSINGVGTGKSGISVVQALRLFVDDVLIDGFGDHGIRVETAQAEIFVADATIRNIGKSAINIVPTGSQRIDVFVERTSVTEAFTAISVNKRARATIRDSSFFHNRNGLIAQTSEVNVINCVYTENLTAITASDDGLVRLSEVAVINNEKGLRLTGGKILAFNHVLIHGNGDDGAPSQTIPTP